MPFPQAATVPFEPIPTLDSGGGGGGGAHYLVQFANDIAGRDGAGVATGEEIYVLDASADPNVDSGPAKYLQTAGGFVQIGAGSAGEQRVEFGPSDPPLTSSTDAHIWIDDRDGTVYARFGPSWAQQAGGPGQIEEIIELGSLPADNTENYDLVRVANNLFYWDTGSSTWVQVAT